MVIRVREISDDEGNRLRRIVRHGQSAIEVKRAQVILASAQGFTPPKIAVIALMSEDYVRQLIHAFNLHGFSMPVLRQLSSMADEFNVKSSPTV